RRLGAKLVAVTGSCRSSLPTAADGALDCGVLEEACPLNLLPPPRTTPLPAIGHALAMTPPLAERFCPQNFASLHPGGTLGKRLMRVESLMHSGKQCPIVTSATGMQDVIYEMSSKGLGMTCVVDAAGGLLGIITDGDLRRQMERGIDIRGLSA